MYICVMKGQEGTPSLNNWPSNVFKILLLLFLVKLLHISNSFSVQAFEKKR